MALTRPNSNNLSQAVQQLQQAIVRDPKFALALSLPAGPAKDLLVTAT